MIPLIKKYLLANMHMADATILFFAVYSFLFEYNNYNSSKLFFPDSESNFVKQIVATLTIIYLVISALKKKPSPLLHKVKVSLLIIIIGLTTFLATFNFIYLRTQHEPQDYIHDHPLQTEEAIKFLIAGKNPYTNNYRDTPLLKWDDWADNPAIYHYISLPSTLYIPIPIFLLSQQFLGWFDHRIITLIFLIIASLSAYTLLKNQKYKIIAVISLCLNPFFTPHIIAGIDDIVFLGIILLSLVLLKKQNPTLSLITMAIAITYKQTAWFILPFYFLYIYQRGCFKQRACNKIIFFIITVSLIMVPFILWDTNSFIEDTYLYPAGNLPTSYPIQGLGLASLLLKNNIISNEHSYFPFWIPQLIILTPLLFWLLKFQKKHPTLGQMLLNYGILLWAFWFLSRFFNSSYIGVLTVIFSIGGLLWLEEKSTNQTPPPNIIPLQSHDAPN